MPLIPAQGSVGASGDLAPLAHLIAALMGEGRIDLAGEILPAARRARNGSACEPLELGPKEGLALINGTQASTAIALDALFIGERVFGAALAAGALSVDALKGIASSRSTRASHEVRGQPGQIRVAAALARSARRQRDRRQPLPLRPGAGPLQLPLPAAGDGRRARPAHQRRAHADDRGRRGDRQSDRVRGRGHRHLAAAISTPSRSPSPPTSSPWRCARSARSRSAAPRSWSTPR